MHSFWGMHGLLLLMFLLLFGVCFFGTCCLEDHFTTLCFEPGPAAFLDNLALLFGGFMACCWVLVAAAFLDLFALLLGAAWLGEDLGCGFVALLLSSGSLLLMFLLPFFPGLVEVLRLFCGSFSLVWCCFCV